jgi:hemolysin III
MPTSSETLRLTKPRLRGVSHQWAFFVSVAIGAALVVAAPAGEPRLAAAIYALSVAALFGYTPFALLVLEGDLATVILIVVWAGALAGTFMKLVWIDAPKALVAVTYIMLGWVAVAAFPDLIERLGVAATTLVAVGGLLYTLGALVYAFQRPNPAPTVFGYHEVFHALVILAAALQYAVIAFYVMPGS